MIVFKKIIKNKSAFTLVEVMLAVGIMSGIALFMSKLYKQQIDSVKEIQSRYDSQNDLAEIKSTISSYNSCYKTFESMHLEKLNAVAIDEDIIIKDIKKIILSRYTVTGELVNKDIIINDKFKKILKTTLIIDKKQIYNIEKFLTLASTLQLKYKITAKRSINKKFNITHYFKKYNNKITYESCNINTISSRKSNLKIIDPEKFPNLKNLSGHEACKSMQLSCAWVKSKNFVYNVTGDNSLGFACQSSYNTSLTGVADGIPKTNIHNCNAKLGTFNTFKKNTQNYNLTCQGIFYAICN